MINFGAVPAGAVLPVFFTSYDANGASITLTGLAVTDIEIYKGVSITQRSSDAGYTLIDTDGIDVDSVTGLHAFSIDTGDNTDAGFYAVGSFYTVVVSAVTINGQTVTFIAATFRIVAAESVAGKPKVDVDAWLGTAAATPTTAGVPEVDVTYWRGTIVPAEHTAGYPVVTVKDGTGTGEIDTTSGGVLVAAIAAGAITAAAIATGAVDADALAADAVAEIADGVWDEDATGHQTGGTFGQAIGDPGADTTTIYQSVVTDAAGTHVAADIIAIKAQTAAIEVDTAEIGAAGAGLTNINLPNQTMDIVGNITGNLSGSVGSVTGAVGSVAAGGIASTSFAAGAIDASAIAADAIGSSELAASAANEIADALLDRAAGVETGWTVRQAMRIFLSALGAKASGLATATAIYRDVGDTKDRITATVDADGNRTAVTLDAT